jgi:trehalose 6-phosphate synthase
VFRACPHARTLLRGLLGNDVLGFHVERYRTNFLRCVDVALEGASVDWQAGEVTLDGHVTRVGAIPMGVPFDEIQGLATTGEADAFRASFDRDHGVPESARIAVGVDRLDYSKGIEARLRALERFWEPYPRWRGNLTYVQNASESRSRIPAYQRVQERVEEEVERINRRFGTDDWQPIVYGTASLSREELYGLYRHADVALVTPIRDGMNLVAQEYVAAQVDGNGVLVLSDQTGAHDEFGDHALSISPFDPDGVAETISDALTMCNGERRRRMARPRRWVADNDLDTWLRRNLEMAARRPAGPDPGARRDAPGRHTQ